MAELIHHGRAHHPERQALRERWPITWADVGLLFGCYVALVGVFVAAGFLITGPFDGSIGATDQRVAERMANGRTPRMDSLSYWGSMLAETGVKIAVTALVVIALVALLRRWEDALLVAVSLILEASVFITVTAIVGRPRPDVPRLDESPVNSSFPSGHVAAAVVYAALALVFLRHGRKLAAAVTAVVVACIAAIVGWARMYRGMHHLSDVVAGVVLGLATLAVVWWIIRRTERRRTVAT